MNRFKNLSKSDVVSCASKSSALRPEVATQVIVSRTCKVNSVITSQYFRKNID